MWICDLDVWSEFQIYLDYILKHHIYIIILRWNSD